MPTVNLWIRGIGAAVLFSFMMAGGALADPENRGKGHGKGGSNHEHQDGHGQKGYAFFAPEVRIIIEDYYRSGRHCPSGLAKKNRHCLPPGQAKKRYSIGGRLSPSLIEPLPSYLSGRLPAPPSGYLYGRVDGDVLLIAQATHRVVDAVVAVNAAMNALD